MCENREEVELADVLHKIGHGELGEASPWVRGFCTKAADALRLQRIEIQGLNDGYQEQFDRLTREYDELRGQIVGH